MKSTKVALKAMLRFDLTLLSGEDDVCPVLKRQNIHLRVLFMDFVLVTISKCHIHVLLHM